MGLINIFNNIRNTKSLKKNSKLDILFKHKKRKKLTEIITRNITNKICIFSTIVNSSDKTFIDYMNMEITSNCPNIKTPSIITTKTNSKKYYKQTYSTKRNKQIYNVHEFTL